jgi:hypothetical protein
MSRDFKKKPIWPALSSGSKRKGRPPFHSLRSFHYEHPFLSLAADAAFTETMLRYLFFTVLCRDSCVRLGCPQVASYGNHEVVQFSGY